MVGMAVRRVKNVAPHLRPELWNRAGADSFDIASGCGVLHVSLVFWQCLGQGGLANMIGMKVHGVIVWGQI